MTTSWRKRPVPRTVKRSRGPCREHTRKQRQCPQFASPASRLMASATTTHPSAPLFALWVVLSTTTNRSRTTHLSFRPERADAFSPRSLPANASARAVEISAPSRGGAAMKPLFLWIARSASGPAPIAAGSFPISIFQSRFPNFDFPISIFDFRVSSFDFRASIFAHRPSTNPEGIAQ
jgi:hypothetical protein